MRKIIAIMGLLLASLCHAESPAAPYSNNQVLVWANEAIVDIYDYSFVNFRERLQKSSAYFTEDGWTNFSRALAESKVLDTVKGQKLNVSAVALRPPILLKHGEKDGVFFWQVSIPTLVHFQSSGSYVQQRFFINLDIQTVKPPHGVRGLAIRSFITKSADKKDEDNDQ